MSGHESHARLPLPSDRSFGLTFAAVFGIIASWMWWKGGDSAKLLYVVAGGFLLIALTVPKLLHHLNVAWAYVGLALNKIVSPIVMGVMFFGLISPIAAMMRWRGRDALQRSLEPDRRSYWIDRNPPGPEGSSFTRQY